MWIKLNKSIFENSTTESLEYLLNILLWYPSESISRYNILCLEIDEIINSNLLDEFSVQLKKKIISVIEQSNNEWVLISNKEAKPKYEISTETGLNTFNTTEAIRFFQEPICIILENNHTDSFFIRSIIYNFDNKDKRLTHFLHNGWIVFQNAGGCGNVLNFYKGYLTKFSYLALMYNRKISEYFIGFSILDSDKDYPSHKNNKYKSLKKELINEYLYLEIYVLKKRTMENYMPDDVFNNYYSGLSYTSHKSWIDAYINLNDEQKDFFNISDGFPKLKSSGELKEMSKEIKQFYNLSSKSINSLKNGFKLKNFKTDFPKNYLENHLVNKQSLSLRDRQNELLYIYNKIKELT